MASRLSVDDILFIQKLVRTGTFLDANIDDLARVKLAKLAAATLLVSQDYTVLETDFRLNCDNSGNDINLQLPPAATKQALYMVVSLDVNFNVNILPDTTLPDTIAGLSSATLNQRGQFVIILSDGVSNWDVIANGILTDLGPYLLLPGRPGGQIASGGTGAGEELNLFSTTDSSRGRVTLSFLQGIYVNDIDEILNVGHPRTTTGRFNVETSDPSIVGVTVRATAGGVSPVVPATGGTITHTGGFYYHEFTSLGSTNLVWPVSGGPTQMDYVMVAGGGGGATGGGGGGGVIEKFSQSVSGGTQAVIIGNGGAGSNYVPGGGNGANGQDTTFNSDTAVGGGGGGQVFADGSNGGSGGGGGADNATTRFGGTGTAGQGNIGGDCLTTGQFPAGGGGGAGAAGVTAPNGTTGGDGGAGVLSTVATALAGSNTYFGGGGGGAVNNGSGTGGAGGVGGGGAGSSGSGGGTAATANTGGGGGGTSNSGSGANGGSGKVIVRYADTVSSAPQTADLVQSLDDAGNPQGGINCFGALRGNTDPGLSSAGSTQADATPIVKNINEFTTVGSGEGCVLPTPVGGERLTVINAGANALSVYPASGGQIDALGTDNPDTVATTTVKDYVAATPTQWYSK